MSVGGVANIDFEVQADPVNKVYRTDRTTASLSWDITNISAGTLRTITGGFANISDVSYDPFMDRVWFIRNDTDDIVVYDRDEIYTGTPTPTLVRTFVLDSDASDAEGLSGPWWNDDASEYEYIVGDEKGGGYYNYFYEITEANLIGSGDLTPTNIQENRLAADGTDNNSGCEFADYDKYGNKVYSGGEGAQSLTPRKQFSYPRPTSRTTDYYAPTDAELDVTEDWDPEVEDHMLTYGATGALADLAGMAYHDSTQTLVWLSQTADYLIWTDLTGAILGDMDISSVGFAQAEGVGFIGDDLIICGELNEFAIFPYTAP